MSAWSVETRRAPPRHWSGARVYAHTTTAIYDYGVHPPPRPNASISSASLPPSPFFLLLLLSLFVFTVREHLEARGGHRRLHPQHPSHRLVRGGIQRLRQRSRADAEGIQRHRPLRGPGAGGLRNGPIALLLCVCRLKLLRCVPAKGCPSDREYKPRLDYICQYQTNLTFPVRAVSYYCKVLSTIQCG